jgi:hypothetical protein
MRSRIVKSRVIKDDVEVRGDAKDFEGNGEGKGEIKHCEVNGEVKCKV